MSKGFKLWIVLILAIAVFWFITAFYGSEKFIENVGIISVWVIIIGSLLYVLWNFIIRKIFNK